jgi:hypothetical protein
MSISELLLAPPEGSPRDRGNKFYQILGGGARMKCLEAFVDLKIPELLGKEGKIHVVAKRFSSFPLDYTEDFIIYIICERSNGIHENMRKVEYCPK